MTSDEQFLSQIVPSERVLLLPHCLRRSDGCQGKYTRQGLECVECNADCPVNRLRKAAIRFGYKGVCVAPGGRLAVMGPLTMTLPPNDYYNYYIVFRGANV